jgi:hypothetical protein
MPPTRAYNSPKCLGTVLQGMFHILKHGLLPDRLFDLSLGFDIERVSFESGPSPVDVRVRRPLAFGGTDEAIGRIWRGQNVRHLPVLVGSGYENCELRFSTRRVGTYMFELPHEIWVTQDLETHHLGVSLDFS